MSNPVSSALFFSRNIGKVKNNGDVGRLFAIPGQGLNAIKGAAETFDGAIGKGADVAVKAFEATKSSSSILSTTAKGVEWASKHVNPLLCVAAGVRVIKAEDKEMALGKEAFAMGAMFAAEKTVKALSNSEFVGKLAKKTSNSVLKKGLEYLTKLDGLENSSDKKVKYITKIVKGIAVVAASIIGYDIGSKIGKAFVQSNRDQKDAIQAKKESIEPQNIEKEVVDETAQNATTEYYG